MKIVERRRRAKDHRRARQITNEQNKDVAQLIAANLVLLVISIVLLMSMLLSIQGFTATTILIGSDLSSNIFKCNTELSLRNK